MPRRTYLLTFMIVVLVALVVPASSALATVPNGFAQSSVLGQLVEPVAMAFSPDETLLFITEKAGKLRIADVSPGAVLTLRATAAIDLTTKTCGNSERGMLGVAVDPNFTTTRYVYLYYTFKRANSCETNGSSVAGPNSPVNRVSRFTVGLDGIIDPASEGILIDNIYSPNGNHNGGDVQFGKDGYLYISVGDGGCDYAGGGCAETNNAARETFILNGKILRIIPDPTLPPAQRIPSDNPYIASGSICALAGHVASGDCQETFARGLRNPFRIAFDPNVPSTRFYINDVGQNQWEEIDLGEKGVDYRWNVCEGFHITGSITNICPTPVGDQRNPIHEYSHSVGFSITGGAAIPNGVWPSGYDGKYLFADYVVDKIFMLDLASPATRTTFADTVNAISHLQFGPGPSGLRSLYYVTNSNPGEIGRITPMAGGNVPPNAVLAATPQFGSKTVTFDGTGSNDPDGSIQDYLWNFGDGNTRTTQTSTTVYIYPVDGSYSASLQVRDTNGALSNSATIQIQTNNAPPVPTITLPAANATFGVGDVITLQGSATDLKDGAIPASSLSWQVLLHHRASQPGAHTHPFFGPQTGNNLTFSAPTPEDLDAASNSYLEVRLTATDSEGASATVSRDLLPAKVSVVLRSVPAGLKISANGTQFNDGESVISWRGYQLNLAGLPQRAPNGSWLALSTWEDNSTSTTRTITTPATPQTYTATFNRTASLAFMPLVKQP